MPGCGLDWEVDKMMGSVMSKFAGNPDADIILKEGIQRRVLTRFLLRSVF